MEKEKKFKLIKIAVFCFIGHAVIVLFSASFYFYWSHEFSELLKAMIRIMGMVFIAYGLLKVEKLAWWIGVILSGVFTLASLLSISAIINPDSFQGRPFPVFDKITIALSGIFFIIAFICLIHPKSRKLFCSKK